MIEKLNIDDIKPTSRRYPAIIFEMEREAGDQILEVKDLEKTKDGELLFSNVDIKLKKGDKVAVVEQMWMNQFTSKTLNRTFDKLLFVGQIEKK